MITTVERDGKLFCPECDTEASSLAEIFTPGNSWFDRADVMGVQERHMECFHCKGNWSDSRPTPLGHRVRQPMLRHPVKGETFRETEEWWKSFAADHPEATPSPDKEVL